MVGGSNPPALTNLERTVTIPDINMDIKTVAKWIAKGVKDYDFEGRVTGSKPTKDYPYYALTVKKGDYELKFQIAHDFKYTSGYFNSKEGGRDLSDFDSCSESVIAYLIDEFMFEYNVTTQINF